MLSATASVAVPFPTNMDLLVETVASAVDESLARIEMPNDASTAPLLVVAQSKHDANWMVEHLLANRLLTRGFSVTLDSTAVQLASMRLSYRSARPRRLRAFGLARQQSQPPGPGNARPALER